MSNRTDLKQASSPTQYKQLLKQAFKVSSEVPYNGEP